MCALKYCNIFFKLTRRTALLKRYHQLHPELQEQEATGSSAGKARRRGAGAFNIARYREEATVAIEVVQDIEKVPMTYEDFEQLKVKEGWSSDKCKVEYEAAKSDPDSVKGKNPAGVPTVEIEVSRKSTYRTRFTKAKTLEAGVKDLSNPSQAAMDQLQRRLMTGMEKHVATSGLEVTQVAQQMASTGFGASSAFDAGNLAVGDVKNLAQPTSEELSVLGSASAVEGELREAALLGVCVCVYVCVSGRVGDCGCGCVLLCSMHVTRVNVCRVPNLRRNRSTMAVNRRFRQRRRDRARGSTLTGPWPPLSARRPRGFILSSGLQASDS